MYVDEDDVMECLRQAYSTGYRDAQVNARRELREKEDRLIEMLTKFAAELGIEVRVTPEMQAIRNELARVREIDAAEEAERNKDRNSNKPLH